MIDNNSTPIRRKRINHHMRKSAEYSTWAAIKTRCYNPKCNNYNNYGGRGIRMCDRWINDFMAFYSDMGPKPSSNCSIDRMDNDGDYEPDNCRWATPEEQHRNRRNTHWFTYNGETLSITEWANRIGIERATLKARLLKYKQPIEKALTQPVNIKHRRKIK